MELSLIAKIAKMPYLRGRVGLFCILRVKALKENELGISEERPYLNGFSL